MGEITVNVPLASARRRGRKLGSVILLLVALGVSLGLAELGARIARPNFPGFKLPQIEHRPAPGLGFEMVPNQAGYTYAEPVRVNSLGLRGPEIKPTREPGSLRVLCLGDSITYGVGVSDDEPYPSQLESMLRERYPDRLVEVVNAGVQRYNTYNELDQLRRMHPQLAPDIVVLGMYPNDLGVRPGQNYATEYENERERAATSFRAKFPTLYVIAKNSALLATAKKAYRITMYRLGAKKRQKSEKRVEALWHGMASELDDLAALSEELHFRVLVLTIPKQIEFSGSETRSDFVTRVATISERLGLPHVDVRLSFEESLRESQSPYLAWDSHMSPEGHRRVALALRDRVVAIEGSE